MAESDAVETPAYMQAINRSLSEISRKLDGDKPDGDKSEKPKTVTRAQLNEAVDAGKLTREQADQLWDEQTDRRIEERAAKVASETVATERRVEDLDGSLARYRALYPNIDVEGSEQRRQVQREFDALVRMGAPQTKLTEVLACQQAFGKIGDLEKAREMAGNGERESERETLAPGGRDRGDRKVEVSDDRPPDYLSAGEKRYYADQIAQGRYSGWKAVHTEMQFASERIRSKAGATKRVAA